MAIKYDPATGKFTEDGQGATQDRTADWFRDGARLPPGVTHRPAPRDPGDAERAEGVVPTIEDRIAESRRRQNEENEAQRLAYEEFRGEKMAALGMPETVLADVTEATAGKLISLLIEKGIISPTAGKDTNEKEK